MKSRTAKLVVSTAYLTISIFAVMASLGYFYGHFRGDFYVFFTNISNYLCMGIIFTDWLHAVKNKEDGLTTRLPFLRFMALIGILLTFLVFNLLLVESPAEYFSFDCLTLHVVLPLLYVLDWVLFARHGSLKGTDPLKAMLYPLTYAGLIYLHAFLRHFDTSILTFTKARPLIYPYFFLDLEVLGLFGVLRWVLILCLAVMLMGYLLFGVDRLLARLLKQGAYKERT